MQPLPRYTVFWMETQELRLAGMDSPEGDNKCDMHMSTEVYSVIQSGEAQNLTSGSAVLHCGHAVREKHSR